MCEFICCLTCKKLPSIVRELRSQRDRLNVMNESILCLLKDKNKQFNRLLEMYESIKRTEDVASSAGSDTALNVVLPPPAETVKTKPIPAPRKYFIQNKELPRDSEIECNTSRKPVLVLSDSLPKAIDLTYNIPGIKTEIRPVASKINNATDHVQDFVTSDVPLIIHTGTNNVLKVLANTVKQRFQRLETNLKAKNIQRIYKEYTWDLFLKNSCIFVTYICALERASGKSQGKPLERYRVVKTYASTRLSP